MDFSLTPRQLAFRDEVRALVDESVTPEMLERMHRTGTFTDDALIGALGERGWLAGAVPGLGERDPIELYLLFHELEMAGAPYDGLVINMMMAGVINHLGNDFLKERVLHALIDGDAHIAMGYSEPDNGSDVANCATRADWNGEVWVINGQKMWTTMAHESSWVLLLTRTNHDVAKHRGLTMFIVPLDAPGVEIAPVHTMGTERTNATYYNDVRIGDEWRIGEVDGGWRVMTTALAFERGVMGGTNPGVHLLRDVVEWAVATGRSGEAVLRERIVRTAIDNQVATLLTQKAAWIAATGGLPGLEGSMAKLFSSEAYLRAADQFLEASAPEGLLQQGTPGAAAEGFIDYHARHAPVTTIYGGTSEIIRNTIAERHLGLPKSR